jgi:hypothetical protein
MARPTKDTKWAASATKTEPSSGQKDAGWTPGQKPPAQWENWYKDAYDVFIKFFNNGAIVAGEEPSMNADPANGLLYSGRDAQSLSLGGGFLGRLRIYQFLHTSGIELWITFNASWDGANWTPDRALSYSTALKMRAVSLNELTSTPAFEFLSSTSASPCVWTRSPGGTSASVGHLAVEALQQFTSLGLANSWADGSTLAGGGTFSSPAYRMDPTGRVWLSGALALGTNNAAIAAALPDNYWPNKTNSYLVPIFDAATLTLVTTTYMKVTPAGLVIPQSAVPAGHGISIDGISWQTHE